MPAPLGLPERPLPTTSATPTMRTFLTSASLCLALSAGFWFALTSTLTDMTTRDCRAGVTAACEQLRRDGVQP